MITIHIIVAIMAVASACFGMVRTSRRAFIASIALSVVTYVPGLVLIIQGASIMHVCMSGLAFGMVAGAMHIITYRRIMQEQAL